MSDLFEQDAVTQKNPRVTLDPNSSTHKRPRLIIADTGPATPGTGAATSEQTEALIDKSIAGTQWILLAILIGVPLGFATNVIIGRIAGTDGPVALGYYRLLTPLLVTTVQTFFLFGGANVLVNFIPRAKPAEKTAFLLSYVGIAALFSVAFFALALIFPSALHFVLHTNSTLQISDQSLNLFLLIFIPIVVLQTLSIAVLQGELELGAAARSQYGVQTVSFVLALVAAFVIIPRHILPVLPTIAGIVIGAYLLSFFSSFLTLARVMRQRWQWSVRYFLPTGFWRFTASVHVLTIIGFFFNSVDQLFIYYNYGVSSVGIFGAAILVATYALWAPNLFTGAMYPFFTNLVAQNDFATLRSAYQRYTAITGVIVALVGLISGLYAAQFIHLFGTKFGDQPVPIMIAFALMYTLLASAAYVPTSALITAHEDVWINLLMTAIALVVRFGLYFMLMQPYGLLGIAIANAISMAVLHVGTLLVIWVRYKITVPPRQHIISLVGGVLLIGYYVWVPTNKTLRFSEPFIIIAIFIIVISQLRLVSRSDFERVTRRLPFLNGGR